MLSETYLELSDFEKAKECIDRINGYWSEKGKKELSSLYIEYVIDYSLYLQKSGKSDSDIKKAIKKLKPIVGLEMEERTKATIYNCLGGFYTNLSKNPGNFKEALKFLVKSKMYQGKKKR